MSDPVRGPAWPEIAVRVTVARKAPGTSERHYETRIIEIARGSNILQLLAAWRTAHDSSLSYPTHFCKLGSCGVCALLVNGGSVLTCRALVDGSDLLIEPLPRRRVLADLLTESRR